MNIADYYFVRIGERLPEAWGKHIEPNSALGKRCIDLIDGSRMQLDDCRIADNSARILERCQKEIIDLIANWQSERNIYYYFYKAFGRYPQDESFRELLISDDCGRDCRQAIDAARSFLNFVENAFGQEDFGEYQKTIAICEHTIECYWRG